MIFIARWIAKNTLFLIFDRPDRDNFVTIKWENVKERKSWDFNFFFRYCILLSNCLGGPFGKKWTDVGAEWNERSEVHSSADGGPFFHEWND